MNEAGLLGRLIPDFGKIVAMMQFNMYHHYTVDEHLLRCVGVLSEIEHGDGETLHPLSHKLMPDLKHQREVLYIAVLLHDIAKAGRKTFGGGRPHRAPHLSPHGPLAGRYGDGRLAGRAPSLMSMTAQTRDLNDRKTIDDFASVVQSVERLKLLLILTVCDIRGVGPGVWNGWKGQLLRTLYYETELLLTAASRRCRARSVRRRRASGSPRRWPAGRSRARRYVGLHYDNYLLTTDLDVQVRHADFVREADRIGHQFRHHGEGPRLRGGDGIHRAGAGPSPPALDRRRRMRRAGGNIVDAQIFTTSDGRALDTILISREFQLDDDESRRAERVGKLIEDVLSGRLWLPEVIAKRTKPKRGSRAFSSSRASTSATRSPTG